MGVALTVASWNVLAAPWASPSFYPDAMDVSVLDRTVRAERVAARLRSLDVDVVFLQETTAPDLAIVLELLGDYDSVSAGNGRDLWATWSTADHPWEPNGTAIVWRQTAFDRVTNGALELSADGNVATWMRARHLATDAPLRMVSVHLDADDPELRRVQLPIALAWCAVEPGVIDVVAGDCNEDTIGTTLGEICAAHGFEDALTVLGRMEPTHPYARPTDDYAPIARLDHILVRAPSPVDGAVIDSGVWDVAVPGIRMEEHLRRTGSDHLPVRATLRL